MDIDVVRPGALSAEQIAAWTAIQAQGVDLESPYLSPHWALAVEAALGAERSDVRVAVLSQEGRPCGFFPVKVKAGVAMPAGAPMCDYQGLIALPDVVPDMRDLLGALGVARFDFSHMPQSQALFAPHIQGASPSWIARLPLGYDAYAHDKNAESGVLKDIERRRRKAEKELGPVRFTAFSRSRADFDQMVAWKREHFRRTRQTDIFNAGWTGNLLRQLFDSREPDFGGVLFTLHIGDRLAAAQFNLRGRNVIHAWMIGHDERFERVSPGLMLFQGILRWMDETPYTALDFGPGEYRFKRQLANADCMIGHGFAGRPGAASLLRSAAYGLRHAAERLPLGPVSELPGKAMRRYDLIRGLR